MEMANTGSSRQKYANPAKVWMTVSSFSKISGLAVVWAKKFGWIPKEEQGGVLFFCNQLSTLPAAR